MRAAVVTVVALAVVGCGGGGGNEQAAAAPDTGASSAARPTAEIHSALLDQNAQPVRAVAADIDDSGRVTAVYVQSVGGRLALHAVLGEPGPRGGLPAFSTPAVIDAGLPHDGALGEFGIAVSPQGHAVATWVMTAPCAADSYRTTGDCRFVIASRRLVGQGWESPVRVGATPSPLPKAIINDNGDVAMMWSAWRRGAGDVALQANAVMVMPADANGFNAPWTFEDIELPEGGFVGMALDRTGHLTMVTAALADGRKHLVARRGSVRGGFGATERLDSLDADVAIEAVSGSVSGQIVVLWQQLSGGSVHRFAATVDAPDRAWQSTDLGTAGTGQRSLLAIGDGGDVLRYDLDNCTVWRRTGGAWQSGAGLPAGLCQTSPSFVTTLSRAGDVVGGLFSATQPAGNTGQWLAYSASRNVLTQPLGNQPADLLLGTRSALGGQLLLAENGIAALVSVNAFDILPSAAVPAGTPGSAANLWLTYLRLP